MRNTKCECIINFTQGIEISDNTQNGLWHERKNANK